MQSFLAEIVDIGDTWTSNEDLVGSVFVAELRSIAFSGFELDSYLLVVKQVCPFEDDTE